MGHKELLVPLDGSLHAVAALSYAEAIARATDAVVRLFAVVERESHVAGTPHGEAHTYLEESRHKELTTHLAETADALRDGGLTVSTEVAFGDPADEILAAADAETVAMTVMATHGRGAPQRLIMGSVADKVMRLSARPTLLVSPGEVGVGAAPVTLRRVMVPLDGSPLAEASLMPAHELAVATGATLTLVRVEPYISVGTSPYEAVGVDFTTIEAEVAAAAEAYLAQVRTGLPANVPVETAVLRGFPSSMLIEYATTGNVDLVVMATHGRGGLRRLVLGSVADRMVRSGVPVLLVRPASPATTAAAAVDVGYHCAACGRLITALPEQDDRCPRCDAHLHACANCVFWDTTGCVLQRAEAYDQVWRGRDCPRFIFRETPSRAGSPRLVEVEVAEAT